MIRIDDLHVTLGDQPVLEGASLGVEAGEFVGLVGPNGAGKTTLLHAVSGRLTPDSGSVSLDGESVNDLGSKAASRRVATVPQDTHVGFAFTVEQLVEMGRTPHRSRLDWSDDADPVDRALERTETTHLRDRTVDEVSGGERQRILLARALAQDAPALLLDEPTASLDINHQVGVLELVRDLVDEGRAALAAIHDLDLAGRFCDRLALLHDGDIAAVGAPETVLRDDRLDTAFQTDAAVTTNPVTGTPTVTAFGDRPERSLSIHVVGGGRPAARVLGTCHEVGLTASLGIVTEGDVAATLAEDLGLETVTVPAHRSPPPTALSEAADLGRSADVIVVADDRAARPLAETLVAHPEVVRLTSSGDPGDDPVPTEGDLAGVDGAVLGPRDVLAAVGDAAADGPHHADD
ncbi:ATP-binding cassette domain-containing protein [Halobacteriales archaeon Cl-PHB]